MSVAQTLKVTTPSDTEIAMIREFDAPRRLVWRTLVEPPLIQRWMGQMPGWSWGECSVDLRVGGKYRYVWNGPDGVVMGMGGVYQEISPPDRIVATELFDDAWYPGGAVVSYTLVEKAGRTTLTLGIKYATKDARDGVLESPAVSGVSSGFDLLAELLKTLA